MEKTEIKKTIVAVSITTFCVLLFSVLMILSSYVPSVRPQVLGANTYSPQNSFVDEISIFAGGQEKIYTVSELLGVAFGYSDNENSRVYLADILNNLGYSANEIEITTELGATIQYDLNSALESPYIIIGASSIRLTNQATFPSITDDIETITINN
ncbi:MAG: hypothetical protein QY330_04060 [Candidatus Dojkabacteria bacterium]|uniref:Uncharacterized protein n=1 Tax=candidate division WS6 bacterium OLB21 TaxID=1617427 RepID=A0A136KG97_9BACT|nr:MAG: hypothetical protein UZ20_WS6002000963 [candidate division WS6 bacterium OLB21]WKZ27696.1 MAG: hypothetical protein QY330_04060 [Candidatus Dojkabacteria bacterium]